MHVRKSNRVKPVTFSTHIIYLFQIMKIIIELLDNFNMKVSNSRPMFY